MIPTKRTGQVPAAALLAAAAALSVAASAGAQQPAGYITIEQPAVWRGEGTRGINVRQKHSIRVVGLAWDATGIQRVAIDGTEASLGPGPDNRVRFVGYANPAPNTNQVEVVAYPTQGAPIVKTYPFVLEEAETAYETPDEAWDSGEFSGQRYAVVIGVSQYRDTAVTSLQYADADARLFYDFLLSDAAGLGGYDPNNVTILMNEQATTVAIRRAMSSGLLRRVTERDVVVFYFAGHGAEDPYTHELYFLTYDTDADDIAATGYPMTEVDEAIGRLRARDIIVIADACHSGAVSSTFATRDLGTTEINRAFLEHLSTTEAGKLIFTAAEANQTSVEDARWGGGHGAFTWNLVQGLGGEADTDGDQIVTLGEMVEFTRDRVSRQTGNLQVPTIAGSYDRAWPMSLVDRTTVAQGPAAPAAAATPVLPPPTNVQREVTTNPDTASTPTRPAPTRPLTRDEVDLKNAGWAFTHSFIIPGSGQMTTGHGARGFLVFAGVAGAAGYVFATRELERRCLLGGTEIAWVGGTCGGTVAESTTFPNLMIGAAAAGALTFIGAIDALVGAKHLNARRLREAGFGDGDDFALSLVPSRPALFTRPGDVPLLELSVR